MAKLTKKQTRVISKPNMRKLNALAEQIGLTIKNVPTQIWRVDGGKELRSDIVAFYYDGRFISWVAGYKNVIAHLKGIVQDREKAALMAKQIRVLKSRGLRRMHDIYSQTSLTFESKGL